ncbi:hypothetical protein V8G54_013197 [Vigna mungo]|uniref:Uncharacterized protein n=1 Tax=Vigna mungo TaxID=3915 RepID=A0AAQ3S4L8_VIGMU
MTVFWNLGERNVISMQSKDLKSTPSTSKARKTFNIASNRHYLCISEHPKCINLCVWCKTKALRIYTSNYTRNKSPMSKIIIQRIFIGPISTLLDVTKMRVISPNASIKYSHLDLGTSVPFRPEILSPKH